jgi:hypothetical protein
VTHQRRTIIRVWPVRFHDGEVYDAQPGETISVLCVDGLAREAFIEFDQRHRKGWWSWESVLWNSDRVIHDPDNNAPSTG